MKHTLSVLSSLVLAAGVAHAGTFSVAGSGGSIPDNPLLVGATAPLWNTTFAATGGTPFTSTVSVANPVTSLTSVTLQGLTHTWRGDFHIFITDPNGASYNIVSRPGFNPTGSTTGAGGDCLLGNYVFVDAGGASFDQGFTNINGGNYNLFFNTGTGQWTNGISNVALSTITGPAGTWTLTIEDWGAQDTGAITGWVLDGTDGPGAGFTAFCTNGSLGTDHTTACPCGNTGAAGNGCGHSFDANGANLEATGTPANDDVVLHSQFEPATSFTLFLQHATAGDTVFHDGVLCAGGTLIRLRGRAAVGGEAFFPNNAFPADQTLTLSQRGGVFPGQGVTRYYSGWFRNASTTFCPPATANITNGWKIDW